ncbi:MAG: hypothetical protein WDW36_009916 [Sanguina aurantia]
MPPHLRTLDPGSPDLLDLEEHDGDLLSHAGPAFALSPLANAKSRTPLVAPSAAAAAAAAAVYGPMDESDPPKITVVVRKRPINRKEKDKGEEDIVDSDMARANMVVNEEKLKVDLTRYTERHQFNFDVVMDESVTNEQVYKYTVQPLVHTLFKSGIASCFAYGQTGSGKTYTMSPLPIRAAADLFKYLARPEFRDITLNMSCFEIYGNKLFDLLNQRKKLVILEDGKKKVVVVGLKEVQAEDVETVKGLIEAGATQRTVAATSANADSSRSHSIMQFALKRSVAIAGDRNGAVEARLVGKISFIDLAGSERGADTFDNNRQTRLEGAEINKSLLALKECIRALDNGAQHVPFRGSKLTAVLRDSFVGGQARTVMIANISPNATSVEHTLNTLRYADRVKELRKEKGDRAPGGVTPGDNAGYYAAISRAAEPASNVGPAPGSSSGSGGSQPTAAAAHPAPAPREKSPPVREREPRLAPRRSNPASELPPPSASRLSTGGDDELVVRHDELMDSILMEEEALVTFHRGRLEEDMEMLRQEMGILGDVDQPGSQIDFYVERMNALLSVKLANVKEMQARLDAFQQKLREEDMLSKTVHKHRNV